MNKLNKETDESHDEESYAGGAEDSGEFFFVGFGALFDEVGAVFVEGD